ncbi:MAG: hypothetical protein MZV49_01095, partial [Rhodopseudomonas palustris]|nr:hypothetical protein [Rhodopseudomonas palustris]
LYFVQLRIAKVNTRSTDNFLQHLTLGRLARLPGVLTCEEQCVVSMERRAESLRLGQTPLCKEHASKQLPWQEFRPWT